MSEVSFEQQARNDVSQANLLAHIEYFCALGEKLAGSPEEKKACDYIVSRLSDAGVDVKVHTFESYVSHPIHAELTTYFPEKRRIEGVTVSFGGSTPAAGLSEEIVYVGNGTEKEFKGVNVRGKIVLMDRLPRPESARIAAEQGASAMVCMSESHVRRKLIVTPVWGTPSLEDKEKIPRLPVASITCSTRSCLSSRCSRFHRAPATSTRVSPSIRASLSSDTSSV